jgi:hypothetical protein
MNYGKIENECIKIYSIIRKINIINLSQINIKLLLLYCHPSSHIRVILVRRGQKGGHQLLFGDMVRK